MHELLHTLGNDCALLAMFIRAPFEERREMSRNLHYNEANLFFSLIGFQVFTMNNHDPIVTTTSE